MKTKDMTRARAERLVASTDDEEVLSEIAKHPNKHVVMKIAFKRLTPEGRRNATAIKHFSRWLAHAMRSDEEAVPSRSGLS